MQCQHLVVEFARRLGRLGDPAEVANVLPSLFDDSRAVFVPRPLVSRNQPASNRCADATRRHAAQRVDAGVHGTRYEYELTPMGKDLATLMTALQQWGDRWIYGKGHEPLLILDRRSGRRIPRLRILDSESRPLAGRDMALAPGPGASKRTRARYGAA